MTVRRQHDIGLSGWFYLLIFIPYIGGPHHFCLRADSIAEARKQMGADAGRHKNTAGVYAGGKGVCYIRNFAMMASPIPVVPTSVMPSDMMSLVRNPSSRTAAIAASTRSASATMPKE